VLDNSMMALVLSAIQALPDGSMAMACGETIPPAVNVPDNVPALLALITAPGEAEFVIHELLDASRASPVGLVMPSPVNGDTDPVAPAGVSSLRLAAVLPLVGWPLNTGVVHLGRYSRALNAALNTPRD